MWFFATKPGILLQITSGAKASELLLLANEPPVQGKQQSFVFLVSAAMRQGTLSYVLQ